ncbi:hypothetical protein TNCV_3826101 [Trichonephila clavipes]|nr:hypothetical protein TNCV_3826101 [Trichonephila clavipes]
MQERFFRTRNVLAKLAAPLTIQESVVTPTNCDVLARIEGLLSMLGDERTFCIVATSPMSIRDDRDILRLPETLGPYAKASLGLLHKCRLHLWPLKVDSTLYTFPNTCSNNIPKQINVHHLQSDKPARPTATLVQVRIVRVGCLPLGRKLGVKITCGNWYLPIGCRTKERHQLAENVLGLQWENTNPLPTRKKNVNLGMGISQFEFSKGI